MPTLASPHLRPVRGDDVAAMRGFLCELSAESRRLRFHGAINAGSERLLRDLTQTDGTRRIAWVAVLPCDDGERIVGEARCVRGDADDAEFAIAVADAWQGRGLAAALMQALQRAAAEAGIGTLTGDVLDDNHRMAAFMRRHGFAPRGASDDGVQTWVRRAPAPAAPKAPKTAPGWAAWLAARVGLSLHPLQPVLDH